MRRGEGTTGIGEGSLRSIVGQYRPAFVTVAGLSVMLNVLTLGGSIYMMLVYDMVLPSHSRPTLFGLLAMVTIIYVFQAGIEVVRGRLLSHVGAALDIDLAARVHALMVGRAIVGGTAGDAMQPVRDVDAIRAFLAGSGPAALIDLPWVLFFVAVLAMFNIWLGVTALLGAVVLVVLTMLTDRMTRAPSLAATRLTARRAGMADTARRNAEVAYALGMKHSFETAWLAVGRRTLGANQRLSDIAGGFGGSSRVFRMLLQSLVLTVGALLVIGNKATGGVIFASAILSARALAPIDLSIANWRGFVAARQSWQRLDAALGGAPAGGAPLALPPPSRDLVVEHLAVLPPGAARPAVSGVSFTLRAGDGLSVIGESAAGKSSLVRGLVGIWPAAAGAVRLDGAALDQWPSDALGRHLGYLPQFVELIDGTVAQNIARFEADAMAEAVIAAAQAAGIHDLVLRLPHGYETPVGPDGRLLSAGQRQRIALARALYRDPFLIVLDEPNSNLDPAGEAALDVAIAGVRRRGGIVVVVAHRRGVLDAVDWLLVMHQGQARAFGTKADVLARLAASTAPSDRPRTH